MWLCLIIVSIEMAKSSHKSYFGIFCDKLFWTNY